MKDQHTFQRYELKYLISKEQQQLLYYHMNAYMKSDPYGRCAISNIYFDTPDRLLIRRSLEKPCCYKEKLRVRSYGIASEHSKVFVELKKKLRGVVYKRRIALPQKTAAAYLTGGSPLAQQSQISKEIDYAIAYYQFLAPAAFLSYDRSAFFGRMDESFRMTFDENILAREYDLSLTSERYGASILPQDSVLLEVKTALGLPGWLLGFLNQQEIYQTSFSKYGAAYTQLMLPAFLKDHANLGAVYTENMKNTGGKHHAA